VLVEVGEQEAASNQCGALAAELGDRDGRPLFSELGIGVAGLPVGITRSRADPSWVQITIWAMALPESVRQNLLAKLRKALLHLAVVVAALELVEKVVKHVEGIA
jgi:hypothetical protein